MEAKGAAVRSNAVAQGAGQIHNMVEPPPPISVNVVVRDLNHTNDLRCHWMHIIVVQLCTTSDAN